MFLDNININFNCFDDWSYCSVIYVSLLVGMFIYDRYHVYIDYAIGKYKKGELELVDDKELNTELLNKYDDL